MFLFLLHNSSIQKEMDRQTVHLLKIIVQVLWYSGCSGADKYDSLSHLWWYRTPALVSHTLQRYWAPAADLPQRSYPARPSTASSFFFPPASLICTHYRNFHGQFFCPSYRIISKKNMTILFRFCHVLSLAGITPSAAYFFCFLFLPNPPCSVDRPDRGGVSVMLLESGPVLNAIHLMHE